ncbi:protein-methionine-sulfoxide reductase heme-binding subunit MsrQ [Shewanella marina]|uniref:protein-methionine-sulfoxide reductase heme-binding subunit MsrQ n=1 Tax=Shewanella marina TaxID=487319 RepID=UPI000471E003|nr:protein-methionine-sulfoxide reductase heme-binding subunit MsrQ [Shewanella marina]
MRLSAKQFKWVKYLLHIGAVIPMLWLLACLLLGTLGGDPVQYIIHFNGEVAVILLILTMLISPIATRFKLGQLVQLRKTLGLYCYLYATLHILSYFGLDLLFDTQLFINELLKRPYIYVGATAYLILSVLAITSINRIKRRIGRYWQKIHNWIYAVMLLVPLHYIWSEKTVSIAAIIYSLLLLMLLVERSNKLHKFVALRRMQL